MVPLKSNSKQIITLYDYQKKAFIRLIAALKKNFRALMVMATGLGKTIVSIEVVKHFLTPKDKVLFLCHDNGILNKTYQDYKKYIGNSYTYAKFYGTGKNKNWEADKHQFVFATFQSMRAHINSKNGRRKLFSPQHFTFVVVDESHHSQAETFAEVINYFTPKYTLGMTATPDREDQADIRDIFGKEVVDIRLPEAIAKGWLTKIDYKVLSDGLDENKIREVCKDVLEDGARLNEKQINEKIFIKVRTEEQCKIVQKYSKTQKAIVFCENIEHLHHVASILPSAVTLHSGQTSKVNDFNFDLFNHGHVQHVIVVDKFNEGIDIPDTELLVFLRATNSERIFLQQLGRGLRKSEGKEKVTVLDFVANIDRIKQVSTLTKEIERFSGPRIRKSGEPESRVPLHVTGKGFSFNFSDQIVNLLNVFERIERDFYPTWQEASEATIALGITADAMYRQRYQEDARLPRHPERMYPDFPGHTIFFGNVNGIKKRDIFYSTWQEASVVVKRMGVKSFNDYKARYKEDVRLPAIPYAIWSDFPGFPTFLGTEKEKRKFYPSWKEASNATKKLGIQTLAEYQKRYKEDALLPREVTNFYTDYPGAKVFFGEKIKTHQNNFYSTWQEASSAVKKLGIQTYREYQIRYGEDKKLPDSLYQHYSDYPGADVFFGKEIKKFYSTWQEASKSVIKLGIKNSYDYRARYQEDSRLPAHPHKTYKDFPPWYEFCGTKKRAYPTLIEAQKATCKLGISGSDEYRKRYKEDPRLPSSPQSKYPDFPGWLKFTGKE